MKLKRKNTTQQPKHYYWLSFIDETLPIGQRNLGACIVRAKNSQDALQRTWDLGLNPGGNEALVQELEDNFESRDGRPVTEFTGRLMSSLECTLDQLI